MTLHTASSLIKGEARHSLLGHLGVAVGTNLLYLFLTTLLAIVTTDAVPGSGWVYFALLNLMLFLEDILYGAFHYGLASIYMNLQYRQPVQAGDLFRGFRENTRTIMQMQLFLTCISYAAELPSAILIQYLGTTWTQHLPVVLPLLLLSCVIPYVTGLIYAMSWFVLLDYPELSAREVLRRARHLMRGNKRLLFYMYLSFLPLYLLSVLSLGIASLWIMPYQYAVEAAFYRGLMNARARGGSPQ